MEKVFGKKINELKFFRFDFFEFNNIKYLISRSGYSKQGGYEIHIENLKEGLDLYDHFFKIGKSFNEDSVFKAAKIIEENSNFKKEDKK